MNLGEAQIRTICDYFHTRPVLKAWLFGSYASGKADSESDVDILLALDYTQPVGLEFIQMQLDLEILLNHKVDLVTERGLSPFMRDAVLKERKLVYERNLRG